MTCALECSFSCSSAYSSYSLHTSVTTNAQVKFAYAKRSTRGSKLNLNNAMIDDIIINSALTRIVRSHMTSTFVSSLSIILPLLSYDIIL